MGMDVYSKTEGAYFRRNVWGWHPLADIVTGLQPMLTSGCSEWHTNSGDGLDGPTSQVLARALRADVENGRAAAALVARLEELGRLPRKQCDLCQGTGLRTDAVGVQYGYDHRVFNEADWKWERGCNGCNGVGTVDDFLLSYHTDLPSLLEFIEFLEQAAQLGGFEID